MMHFAHETKYLKVEMLLVGKLLKGVRSLAHWFDDLLATGSEHDC